MPYCEDRRDFLKKIALISFGTPLIASFTCCDNRGDGISSNATDDTTAKLQSHKKKWGERLIQIQSRRVISKKREVNPEVLSKMLDTAMEKLIDRKGIDAWRELFSPDDVVAIKVSCLPGKRLSTHPELVNAIVKRLKEIKIKGKNIIIYDRTSRELEAAGFTIQTGEDFRCFGTDTPGVGYDSEPTILGELGSCFSKIISEFCSAIINVPVLKDHDMCGVTCSLKNHLGSIDNPNKCHPNSGDPYIAEVNTAPCIREKSRLIICDALLASYDGGPAFNPRGTWDFGGILVGTDPVAIDTQAWNIIEKKRKEKGLPTLKGENREPTYIKTASDKAYGLGSRILKEAETPRNPGEVELITISDSHFDSTPDK